MIEKLFASSPIAEGSIQRRLVSGTVLAGALALRLHITNTIPIQSLFRPEEGSVLIAASLLLGTYALGSVIELIGETFVVRAAGGGFRTYEELKNVFRMVTKIAVPWKRMGAMILLCPILLITMPIAYPIVFCLGVAVGVLGILPYRTDIGEVLERKSKDTEARPEYAKLPAIFSSLAPIVQRGLREPFSEFFEVAWSHLHDHFSEHNQKLIEQMAIRLKDTLCYVTAILLSIFILGVGIFTHVDFLAWKRVLIIYAVLGGILLLFSAYFILLNKAIRSALMLTAVDDRFTSLAAAEKGRHGDG